MQQPEPTIPAVKQVGDDEPLYDAALDINSYPNLDVDADYSNADGITVNEPREQDQ